MKKISFVTAIAWMFIILGAYSALMATIQTFLHIFISPVDILNSLQKTHGDFLKIPPFLITILNNTYWIILFSFTSGTASLIAGIALLKRKNWARIFFIAILLLSIPLAFTGYFLIDPLIESLLQSNPGISPTDAAFQFIPKMMELLFLALGVTIALLHGWIVFKLMSGEIKKEFL